MAANLGVVFVPSLPPERLRGAAETAESAGLDELWLWEDCFLESGIATAAAALAWTDRLTVGVGLLPVPLRNVALTAMELATIGRLFPGRSRVAVGHGVQSWMEQVGAKAESPVTLLREHVLALRSLLAGEPVDVEGRYVQLRDVVLGWPPARPTAILAGATGPTSLRLVGEVADGVVITGTTSPVVLRRALDLVAGGARAAGRSGRPPAVVYVIAVTGTDAPSRLDAELRRWGLETEGGTAVGDPDGAPLGVAGDAASIAEGLRAWVEAGADTVVLQPPSDDPDIEAYIRFVAEQVAPLL